MERSGSRIDPRIRARRAEILRTEARRRLRIALAVLAVLVALAGAWFLLHSRILSARVVTVVGSVHTPVSEIVDAAGLAAHPPLIDVGAAAVAGVDRLPWVARATVTREWPDGVRIHVVERTPVAAMPEPSPAGEWAVLDRGGEVLAVTSKPPAALVRVSAATTVALAPGTTLTFLRAALDVAATLPAAFGAQVTDVRQDMHGTVTLQLTSPVTVYLGSTASLAQKYEDVAAILAGAPLPRGATVDVASPAAPVVTP